MKKVNVCEGPILKNIVLFSIPVILSGILQLLYNAADVIVVGRFAGKTALAAVGSTGSITNFVINILTGFSVGATVLTANRIGAKAYDKVKKTVNTSLAVGFAAGLIFAAAAILFTEKILTVMNTPEDVIDQAELYLKIYFAGLPVSMLYNFAAAILRAMGDTKTPFKYLAISGIVNVVLNVIFVVGFGMGVEGVAIPTVISQALSAFLCIRFLMRGNEYYKLKLNEVRIDFRILGEIVSVGLPAGIQGAVFSLSNMIIQSSINSFGSDVMAGNAAAGNLEGFVYVAMNSIHQTAVTFAGQNIGARNMKRVKHSILACLASVTVLGLVLGNLTHLFGRELLRIYTGDAPEVIEYGMIRLKYICVPYFVCGVMDVLVGSLRGMGTSLVPMLVSIAGVCGIRLVWIFTVFAAERTLDCLYISYLVSWSVTAAVQAVSCVVIYKLRKKAFAAREEAL